jgi:menaquinone-specific isochorismate synthase
MATMLTMPQRVPATSIDIDSADALLGLLPDHDPIAWVRRGEGMVAWGQFARAEFLGPTRFADASRWWRDLLKTLHIDDRVRTSGSGPLAFASFAFNDDEPSVIVVPQMIVGRRGGQRWLTWIGDHAVPSLPDVAPLGERGSISWSQGALSPVEWQAAVAWTVSRIQSGDVDKVVLARDILAESSCAIDLRNLLISLEEQYPSTWTFALNGLVGATPELLLRLTRGLVTSRVLAGTIRKTGDDQRDLALAASLARSSKDLEEHEYAVASVAESLADFCSSTNIPDVPFVLHLANVMHLASDVTGVLSDSISSRDAFALLEALHPSAAVCGTPRESARALIREVEGMTRGRYAGPIGWIDSKGDGEFGIALRCAEVTGRQARLFAGCGIVAGSDPEAELAESQAKLLPMRTALED